jgi:regulator of protease activity HflC (stomatin/prohibitin superfamily)
LIILVNIFRFFIVVDQGERGVLLEFGHAKAVYEPGLHFQIPIVHKVVVFDVRTKKDQVEAGAASKDLQLVQTTIALNYHPDPTTVDKLYQEVGTEYETRVISPAIQESVKAATAKYTAEELITKRSLVKEDTRQNLAERLESYHVIIDDFSIVDFSFSEEFDLAIEAKQTAVQQALKAENDLRRIEIEAQQVIETAKAEAESIRIQAAALKENADLIQLKFVEQWNGVLPVYMMGDSIPLINL